MLSREQRRWILLHLGEHRPIHQAPLKEGSVVEHVLFLGARWEAAKVQAGASHKMDTIATALPLTIQSVKAAIPGLSPAVEYTTVPLGVDLVRAAFGAPLGRVSPQRQCPPFRAADAFFLC